MLSFDDAYSITFEGILSLGSLGCFSRSQGLQTTHPVHHGVKHG